MISLNPTNTDIYAYQILYHLVSKYQYQIVTIKQQQEDIWLMNPKQETYPIIRLSTHSNGETLQNMDYLKQAHQAISDIIQRQGKLLIINTSEDSSPIENDVLTQYVVHPGAEVNEALSTAFAGIETAAHDVEDNQKEYIRITRNLEEIQMRMLKQQQKLGSFVKRIPKITGIVAGICILLWLLVNMAGIYLENGTTAAILCGAYYKMNIVSMNEYWRFLTSGFLHVDIFHLLMNVIALVNLGMVCEKLFKKGQYIAILLSSIVVGNIFVFLLQGNTIGVGISGGIFGLLGAFIVALCLNGSIKHPMVKASVLRLLFINLLISMLPNISFYAHLGGFLCGVFMGFILLPNPQWAQLRKHMMISFTILLGFVTGYCLRINVVEPVDKALDRDLLTTVRSLGMDWYGDKMQDAYLQYHTKEDLGL